MKLPCGIVKIETKAGVRYMLGRVHGENVQWMDRRFARIGTGARQDMVWADLPANCGKHALAYVGELADREAVLLGKGPSLKTWLEDPRWLKDNLLVSINETFALAPRPPDFALALDAQTFANLLPSTADRPETIWVQPTFCLAHSLVQPLPAHLKTARWSYGDFGTTPGVSTAGMALRWLWLAGVRKVYMVGFDGIDDETGRYADILDELVDYEPPASWEKVNRDIRKALDATGMEVVWWHRLDAGHPVRRAGSVVTASEAVDVESGGEAD